MIDKCIVPNKDKIAYRAIDDETVVINLTNNELNILNPVATFIWEHLDGRTRVNEIVKKLTKEFEVDYKTAKKDCMDFISKSIAKGIAISI